MMFQNFLSKNFQSILAGMPSVTVSLSDLFRMRLQTVSFFLLIILLSAWVIRLFWNALQKEFPKLLPLSYKAALLGTILWGLLFVFVLTMISGARELMTPGAWKQVGRTYQLKDEEGQTAEAEQAQKILKERREAIRDLRTVLWAEAATHEGKFPSKTDSGNFSKSFWMQPGGFHVKYHIIADKQLSKKQIPLVIEQAIYGDNRQFVLFTNGAIELLLSSELKGLLND